MQIGMHVRILSGHGAGETGAIIRVDNAGGDVIYVTGHE